MYVLLNMVVLNSEGQHKINGVNIHMYMCKLCLYAYKQIRMYVHTYVCMYFMYIHIRYASMCVCMYIICMYV